MNNENLQDADDPESDENGLKEETDNKGVSNLSNISLHKYLINTGGGLRPLCLGKSVFDQAFLEVNLDILNRH